jgi:tetratricopeptide (TPR) repeat protein
LIVTFYSYKGGVGRSLALANVAYALATNTLEPRKVLVWDFDLEAPGLQNVFQCKWGEKKVGFIDLVSNFLQEKKIRPIRNFIHKTNVNGVDILPAGYINAKYSENFGRLNWRDFYSTNNGYEFVEEVKSQLCQHAPTYDYILIDSRTGYSDVSGICTLQLPDVVVLVFRLNDQNLEGVKKVNAIIQDHLPKSKNRIDIVPVISPSWPFGAMEANNQVKKAKKVFGQLKMSCLSFDPALNYKEKILLRERDRYAIDPPICTDYIKLTERIRRLNQEDPETVLEGGKELLRSFDYKGAFQKFERLVTLRPNNSNYWGYFIEAAIDTPESKGDSNIKKAEELLNEQLAQNQNSPGLLLEKARLLFRRGSSSAEIEPILSKALHLDPELQKAYVMRGMLHLTAKAYGKAVCDFTKLIELNRNDSQAYYNRAQCFSELEQFAEAERDFKRAIQLSDREPSIYFDCARMYFKQEQYKKSEATLKTLLTIAPSYKHGLLLYAHVLAGLGKIDEAAEALARSAKGTAVFETKLNLFEAYLVLGEIDEAMKILPDKIPDGHRLKQVPEILKAFAHILAGDPKAITSFQKDLILQYIKQTASAWSWTEFRIFLKRSERNATFPAASISILKELIAEGGGA